ncbi:Protein PSK SIMULATOR 3 [Linum grandiflorum]
MLDSCHILDLRCDAAKEVNSTFKSIFSTKFVVALPETLGATALALHYANVIIVIEKLAASPNLISHDARDDLYSMLPASVRITLRHKLKPYAKSLASSPYDSGLAREWTEAIASILEWLSPLAHNMIRWQTERSFEQQNFVSRTNVFLVQTLFYASQDKTEATIAELLVGLNYLWRSGRERDVKARISHI